MEMKTTLGQLINQDVLSDHFDHYGAPSLSRPSYDRNHNQTGSKSASNSYLYDTGNTFEKSQADAATDDEFVEANTEFVTAETVTKSYGAPPKSTLEKPAEPRRRPLSTLSRDDTYLCTIENDVRKRINGPMIEPIRTQDDTALTTKSKNQQTRHNNLSKAMDKQMGSLPDITILKELQSMPKADLMKLNAAKREEIKKLFEEQERRNAGDITVLAGDMKVRTVDYFYCSQFAVKFFQLKFLLIIILQNHSLDQQIFHT